MLQVLMAFFVIVFSFLFLSFVAQAKMQFHSVALQESIDLQKKIIKAEKMLFDMNLLSTTLRLKLAADATLLSLASIAMDLPEMIRLGAEIAQTIKKQKQLDKVQKTLINTTNAFIKIKVAQLTYQLNSNAYSFEKNWSHFLTAFFAITPTNIPTMAVQADTSAGWGPNYGLTKNYKQQQMVAFKWHLFFFTKDDAQKFLDTKNYFELSAGATANKGDTWSVEIKKDKY